MSVITSTSPTVLGFFILTIYRLLLYRYVCTQPCIQIYREICADICIICVHECLSNLMTSTQQRQFSSWYHFVALLLLYPLVPVINAYLLRNKFVPNLYKDPTIYAYSYFFVAENSWISRCFNR